MPCRCPRCAAAAAAAAKRRCEETPVQQQTPAPVSIPAPVRLDASDGRYCYDLLDGSGGYYAPGDRNPFWPSFAHPRGVTSDTLYTKAR